MSEITFVTSYDSNCKEYANTLMTLVSDDEYLRNIERRNEKFEKDESIVSDEYVLTIGKEASKFNMQNFKDKYNNYGIHFGYHGTKAWIYCENFKWDKESLFKFHSELISVLDEFGMKTDNIDDKAKEFIKNQKKEKKNMRSYNGNKAQQGDLAETFQDEAYEVLMNQIAVTNILQENIRFGLGFVGIIYMSMVGKWFVDLLKKSERRKQQYKYAIVLFYKRYIHEFLKLDEKNKKEKSEKNGLLTYTMTHSNNTFETGYKYGIDNLGAFLGGELTRQANQPYLESIQKEIDNLTEALNKYEGNANPQLKGYVAEAWHTYTFNIDAAAKQSAERATQVESNGLGSVDVSTSWGEDYSLKYYQNGAQSALAQGHSLEYAYQRYIHKLGEGVEIPTREEYLKMSGIDPNTNMQLGMYEGQARLIPSDQLKDAIESLNKRIQRDLNNLDNPSRAESAQRLIEVRDKLTSHILGPNGEQSLELTEKESRLLAEQAKEGKFDPARYDITLAKKADAMFICGNAMRAGLNAAWISALLKMVPQLVTVIKRIVQNGFLDFDELENAGKSGLSGAKYGFFRGFLCAAITSSSELGYLGNAMQNATCSKSFAPCVGVAVVLLCQAVSDGIKCAKGELTKTQYAYNIERNLYIGVGGLVGGLALQSVIEIPVVSYAVGSMIGSLLGGFVFTAKEQVMMSLCVKNGYTVFGLVEQDYTMPDAVRKKLGFPVYGFKDYHAKEYKFKTYQQKTYNQKTYNWKRIDSIILERGVIGFRKVGYIY